MNPLMNGRRKRVLVLVSLLVASLIVSSCSNGDELAKDDGPVTIHIQLPIIMQDPTSLMYENAVLNFHKLHPNVTVVLDYTELQPGTQQIALDPIKLLQEDIPPDIVPMSQSQVQLVADKGLLKDLLPLQPTDNSIEVDIPKSLLDSTTVDGKLLLLPYAAYPLGVYYNKRIFDEAQVPYPADGWTWEQFRETSRQLHADYGSMLDYDIWTLEMLLGSLGAKLLSEDGSTVVGYLDSPEAVKAMKWLNAYYRDDARKSKPQTFVDSYEQFNDFNVGMVVNGAGVGYPNFEGADREWLGVSPLPYFEGGQRASPLVGVQGIGIPQKSLHPQEAWSFISYLMLQNNVDSIKLARGYYPTSKKIADGSSNAMDTARSVFLEEMDYAVVSSFSPLIMNAWDDKLQAQFDELLDTEDNALQGALHEIALQFEQSIARAKSDSEHQAEATTAAS
ncbi:extracellular solute-binding protein [Cohnella yongneupensis]|uniref:Extracellular solute-binding protein n=1 Tax=Cohnella yongneupensis TaxID=425006 RepID=A0ABW0R290_9BACL